MSMEKSVKLSIIMPVYNAEKYLSRSIESVLAQTFVDFELICVNDGSTDGSLSIINSYASKDSRIKVFSKDNGGQISARKMGVEHSSGDYIGFIDDDDYIEIEMYNSLVGIAEKYNVDMVSSSYYVEGNYTSLRCDSVGPGIYNNEQMQYLRDNAFYCAEKKQMGLRGTIWNKIFKANLVKDNIIRLPDTLTQAEDRLLLMHIILDCSSAYISSTPFYHWCIRESSRSHEADDDFLLLAHEIKCCLDQLKIHKSYSNKTKVQADLYLVEFLGMGININMNLSFSHMLRLDPIWMNTIPQNASILIYGGGELGDQYKRQLSNMRKDVTIVKDCGFEMPAYDDFAGCDLAVIGIKNEGKAMEVKTAMMEIGIPEDRILWTPQPEFFWKYAEAEGLLD